MSKRSSSELHRVGFTRHNLPESLNQKRVVNSYLTTTQDTFDSPLSILF